MTFMLPEGVSFTLPPLMVTVALLLTLLLISPLFFTVTVPAPMVMLPSALMPMALYPVPSSSLVSELPLYVFVTLVIL